MPKYKFTFQRQARVPFIGDVMVEAPTMEEAENEAETLMMQGSIALDPIAHEFEFEQDAAVIIHRENVEPITTSIVVRVHIPDTPKEAYTRLCDALATIEAGAQGVPIEYDSSEYTTVRDGEPESEPRPTQELWPTPEER